MRFFKKAKTTLQSNYFALGNRIQLQILKKQGKNEITLELPLEDVEFREYFQLEGFESYIVYEELFESDFIDYKEQMTIDTFYSMLDNEDQRILLGNFGLPTEVFPVSGQIEIIGSPAHEPKFVLTLRDMRNRVLEQIAETNYPFIKTQDASYIVSEEIWRLYEAIQLDEFQSGYEKTAKIRKLAVEANIQLDDFLKRENYHYIDSYEVQPRLIANDLMELQLVGQTKGETEHLNSNSMKSSIRIGTKRERYEASKAVREDVQILQKKKYLKNEEIPQFFQNPLSLFPDHEFLFDLEKFSERVVGFVEITKPRMQMVNGKRKWFDDESGKELDINEEELRNEISKYPDQSFINYKKAWVYADNTLKRELGLLAKEEKQKIPNMVLDIIKNEDKLEFQLEADKSKTYIEQPVSNQLKANLFDHQVEGYSWICSLYDSGKSGLLADDMGLGKTIQVITFLLRQYEQGKLFPTLIVLPIALIDNWINEISEFAPILSDKIYVHQGSGRIRNVSLLETKQLIFISYDTLKIDQLIFGQIRFECIIADEAQNVKSNSSNRSRAIRAMQGNFRLAMTGTPVENSLEELWTIMDFVQPGAMRSLSEFRNLFVKNQNYDLLMETLFPFYLRRTKAEVLKDKLPGKHILEPSYVQASSIQQELAGSMMSGVKAGKSMILNVISDLRMLYAHPGVFEGVVPEINTYDSPKLEQVLKHIEDIKIKDEKVLIFTEFRKIHSILKNELTKKYGISVPIINGDTKHRPEVVKSFNNKPGFGVMILSPKAAGVGLTITSANHVIHYTRWWNPAVENQATDRAYRIGQTKDVYVYQIITQDKNNFPNGTVEEIMHQLLTDKSELAENVIIPFDTKSFQQEIVESFGK
ncbi:DEAD/DEAH box helicase [Psychrobacillus sp. MER TA 171]|uniref:DEAD/DEAH box helicase n=1 Tax=Psychrobacillus sp. MER TA 171 TaxID=2939577 RepID=UPI00203A9E2C|nr:DEAD/DEAH box helicase [Psychrobacillus sp. MER TA 171]MCM3359228.1 DEAD/DEAH box helicase [Psychrobacillus sp. MER TA 171]